MRTAQKSYFHLRLLQSTAALVFTVASAGVAQAQTANVLISNVNVLNLLSPFLSLNGTTIGQQTLSANLAQAIATNNGANARRLISYLFVNVTVA